jgi:hypothetical protein
VRTIVPLARLAATLLACGLRDALDGGFVAAGFEHARELTIADDGEIFLADDRESDSLVVAVREGETLPRILAAEKNVDALAASGRWLAWVSGEDIRAVERSGKDLPRTVPGAYDHGARSSTCTDLVRSA